MTKQEVDKLREIADVTDEFVISAGKSVRHDVTIKTNKGTIELYSDVILLSNLDKGEQVSNIKDKIQWYHIQE